MRPGDIALLVLRLTLAVVMWPHGAQKALGLFDGPGIGGTVPMLGQQLGLPAVIVYLVIAVEFLGPIALVLGVLTRLAALGIGIDMAVAATLVHARNGFFMNFSGKQAGEGVEFFVLIVGIAAALVIAGSGRIAALPRT